MGGVSGAFLGTVALILLGAALRALGVLTTDHGRAMSTVVLYVTLPALIVRNVSSISISPELLILAAVCILWSAVVLVPAFSVFRAAPESERGLLIIASIGYNIGLFAMPIIESIYGEPGVQLLAAFDIGSAITNFSLAFVIAGLLSPSEDERRTITVGRVLQLPVRSVPLLSYVIALVIAASGFVLPFWLDSFLGTVAAGNQVLVFLALGVFLEFRIPRDRRARIFVSLLLRYAGGLGLGLVLYFTLPMGQLYRTILAVALILPASVALLPFSVRFGYREDIASAVINLSILISLPLMWVLILLLGPS